MGFGEAKSSALTGRRCGLCIFYFNTTDLYRLLYKNIKGRHIIKRQSLIYQAKAILTQQFTTGFGRSKHVDKKYNSNINIIYSRNTYKNALQKCCTFLRYCKDAFQVKNLEDLQPEYFNQFVQDKKYTKDTANLYRWALKKLQTGYNTLNFTEYIWSNEGYRQYTAIKAENYRKQIPKDIHEEIIKKAYANKYTNGLAFDIARTLGLRISEITNLRMNDFKFDKSGCLKEVYIHRSKGGRDRRIFAKYLTNEQIAKALDVYNYFIDLRGCNDRLFTNKADSYRKAFSNARKQVAPQYNQCSIHSLRKEFANRYYHAEINKGRQAKEVKQELTLLLGHCRLDILRYYINPSLPTLQSAA